MSALSDFDENISVWQLEGDSSPVYIAGVQPIRLMKFDPLVSDSQYGVSIDDIKLGVEVQIKG